MGGAQSPRLIQTGGGNGPETPSNQHANGLDFAHDQVLTPAEKIFFSER